MKYIFLVLTFIFSSHLMAEHFIDDDVVIPPAKKVEKKVEKKEEKKEEEKKPKTPEEFLTKESGEEGYKQILAVIAQTNQERLNNGRPPLKINYKLMYAAREQAQIMARTGIFDHKADGTTVGQRVRNEGYQYMAVGENIAGNYSHTDVVQGWMNSPGHRRNILDTDFTEIGVYRAYTASGYPYWAQVFGRR